MTTVMQTDLIGLVAFILLVASWLVFGLIFGLRKKPPKAEEAKRAPAATLGIILQGISFAAVWTLRRGRWWPFPPSISGEVALACAAVILAWAGNWWVFRSVQTLGKQWTYRARLIEGHELIIEGPYRIVRNPIYLGMFALLAATGLVVATWWGLLAAAVVFLIGNQIRIRAEERLLRESFGEKFDEYARRVPAFVPRLW